MAARIGPLRLVETQLTRWYLRPNGISTSYRAQQQLEDMDVFKKAVRDPNPDTKSRLKV